MTKIKILLPILVLVTVSTFLSGPEEKPGGTQTLKIRLKKMPGKNFRVVQPSAQQSEAKKQNPEYLICSDGVTRRIIRKGQLELPTAPKPTKLNQKNSHRSAKLIFVDDTNPYQEL